jgi:hypothetical protein
VGATADAADATDANAADASGTDAGIRGGGLIIFQQDRASATDWNWRATAFFSALVKTSTFSTTCAPQKIDACLVYHCSPTTTATVAPASTGTITISGGRLSHPATLVPDLRDNYGGTGTSTRPFLDGETLRFQSTGAAGGIGPIDRSLEVPSVIAVTAPVRAPIGHQVPIDRAAPFEITWSVGPNASGEVTVSITSLVPSATSAISCMVPASAGSFQLSPALLSNLPAGLGDLNFGTIVEDEFVVDAFSIGILITSAVAPGSPDEIPVEFR